MRNRALISLLIVLALSGGAVVSQSVTGTGYEWHHLSIWDSSYQHPITGKSAVPSLLDHAELSGWQLQATHVRSLPEGTRWDFVFRAPVGATFVPLPLPATTPAPPAAPPVTTTACPGTAPVAGWTCYPDGGWRP